MFSEKKKKKTVRRMSRPFHTKHFWRAICHLYLNLLKLGWIKNWYIKRRVFRSATISNDCVTRIRMVYLRFCLKRKKEKEKKKKKEEKEALSVKNFFLIFLFWFFERHQNQLVEVLRRIEWNFMNRVRRSFFYLHKKSFSHYDELSYKTKIARKVMIKCAFNKNLQNFIKCYL